MPMMLRSKRLSVTIIILVVLIGAGAAVLIKQSQRPSSISGPSTLKQATPTKDTTDTATTTNPSTADTTQNTAVPLADPKTLNSIDIQPLSITVFYSKGTPGFEFNVLKTADTTQYVQFSSPDLIGSKCTNDQGAFASIIKNPSTSEGQTTSQTVKVGNDTYGLSLSSAGCTGNPDLLVKYQTGFKNGFSNLSVL